MKTVFSRRDLVRSTAIAAGAARFVPLRPWPARRPRSTDSPSAFASYTFRNFRGHN